MDRLLMKEILRFNIFFIDYYTLRWNFSFFHFPDATSVIFVRIILILTGIQFYFLNRLYIT